MFNFLKKNSAKKHSRMNNRSNNDIAALCYMHSVEDGIIPYWADDVLMQTIGVTNLFAENIQIKTDLTFEEAYDSIIRASKMVDIARHVGKMFSKGLQDLKNNEDAGFTNANNPNSSRQMKHHPYCSANTIRDLFIAAKDEAAISEVKKPETIEEAIIRLSMLVNSLSSIKEMTFIVIMFSAQTSFVEMQGFID